MAKDGRAYSVRSVPSIPPAGYTGATWSDGDEMVYAIDALSDSLFEIDPETSLATFVAPLSLPMGTVGIEMHPDNGV